MKALFILILLFISTLCYSQSRITYSDNNTDSMLYISYVQAPSIILSTDSLGRETVIITGDTIFAIKKLLYELKYTRRDLEYNKEALLRANETITKYNKLIISLDNILRKK